MSAASRRFEFDEWHKVLIFKHLIIVKTVKFASESIDPGVLDSSKLQVFQHLPQTFTTNNVQATKKLETGRNWSSQGPYQPLFNHRSSHVPGTRPERPWWWRLAPQWPSASPVADLRWPSSWNPPGPQKHNVTTNRSLWCWPKQMVDVKCHLIQLKDVKQMDKSQDLL